MNIQRSYDVFYIEEHEWKCLVGIREKEWHEWQGQKWYFIEDHGFHSMGINLSQAISWE